MQTKKLYETYIQSKSYDTESHIEEFHPSCLPRDLNPLKQGDSSDTSSIVRFSTVFLRLSHGLVRLVHTLLSHRKEARISSLVSTTWTRSKNFPSSDMVIYHVDSSDKMSSRLQPLKKPFGAKSFSIVARVTGNFGGSIIEEI